MPPKRSLVTSPALGGGVPLPPPLPPPLATMQATALARSFPVAASTSFACFIEAPVRLRTSLTSSSGTAGIFALDADATQRSDALAGDRRQRRANFSSLRSHDHPVERQIGRRSSACGPPAELKAFRIRHSPATPACGPVSLAPIRGRQPIFVI